MTKSVHVLAALGVVLAYASVGGQAPPAPTAASSPGFDLSGYWTAAMHEDALERGAGPELGDYGGFPINEAARLFALSYDASRVTLRHHQCDGYVAPYSVRSIGNARAWEERDPHTQRLIAIHWYNQTFEGHRTIWMDGRPHPPEYAPHTWQGFSTGKWDGDMLTVTTTHLKIGWIRRNGIPRSDKAVLTEHWIRHGDTLTLVSIINDPAYLTEPFIRTTNWVEDPRQAIAPYPCEAVTEIPRPLGVVPHHLPGTNTFLSEFPKKYGVPPEAARGGAETMYPEYRLKIAAGQKQ